MAVIGRLDHPARSSMLYSEDLINEGVRRLVIVIVFLNVISHLENIENALTAITVDD